MPAQPPVFTTTADGDMKGYTQVARQLRANGVDTVFGLMGEGNMMHVVEFIRREQGRFIAAAHEGGAVSMADGYSRIGRRVGVASVTHGPGATNAITALTEAVRARSRLVVLSADSPDGSRDHLQRIDLRAVAHVAGAAYWRVHSPRDIGSDLSYVLGRVASTRQPTLVDVPIDVQEAEMPSDPRSDRSAVPVPDSLVPDGEALDLALGILMSARRPVIVAGRGAAMSGARSELVALGELVGAPLATSLFGKDLFRGEPFDLGIMGTVSHAITLDTVNQADTIVAFGASLNEFTTVEGSLLDGKAVIHCDIEPAHLQRYAAADAPIVGDARATAQAMRDQLAAAGRRPGSFRSHELRERLAHRNPHQDYVDKNAEGFLDMRTAMIELDAILPPDRILVTDAGRFMYAPWRYLHVQTPADFTHSLSFGSIGLGVGMATGAAAVHPDRTTVGVVGDGGLMMALNEVNTAVRYKLPLVLIVLNDGSYGAEYNKFVDFGVDPVYSMIDWPELSDVATALGAHGIAVRSVPELAAVGEYVREGRLPLLVDIKADPAVNARE